MNLPAQAEGGHIPTSAPPPSGIVAWWPGNGNAQDIVGGHNGILQDFTTFAPGEVGEAFQFYGTNGGVIVPDAPALNFGAGADFSIEAWIKVDPTATKPILSIVDKRLAPVVVDGVQYGGAVGYALGLTNGRLFLAISPAPLHYGNAPIVSSPGPDLRDGQFHHVAATVDRNSTFGGNLYVDGQVTLNFNPTPTYFAGDLSNTQPLNIGRHATPGFDGFFKGEIDELSIYNRALSGDEIRSIYRAGSAGKSYVGTPSLAPVPVSISTFAGSIAGGQDGSLANATFFSPNCVTYDRQGRLWVVEGYQTGWTTSGIGSHRLRIIDANGLVSTVAGSPDPGWVDGWGTAARFNVPFQLVFDFFGNAFVSDRLNHRIRRIDANSFVSTWAGSSPGYQDGWGASAMFHTPIGIAMDASNNLYVADFDNFRIRKVNSQGFAFTFAGSVRGNQDGPLSVATFDSPHSLAFAKDGTLYVADYNNSKIRRISSTGIVTTFAASLPFIEGVTTDDQGAVYASLPPGGSQGPQLYKFNPDGSVAWVVQLGLGFRDGPVAQAQATRFGLLTIRPDGNILFPDSDNHRIRLLTLAAPSSVSISPNGGLFTNSVTVTLSTLASNAAINYTLDGTAPGSNSVLYTGPFRLFSSATVAARAFVNGYPVSEVVTAGFFVVPAVQAVSITRQPQSQTVTLGSSVSFSVIATGGPPLTYQWYFNSLPLPSATTATLFISNVQSNNLGYYFVAVSNLFSGVTSAAALLSVPTNQTVAVRHLPGGYFANTPVTVTIQVNPPAATSVYAVQDRPPAGWIVGSISDSGTYDAFNRWIKFGPFLDAQPRMLTYTVTPTSGLAATFFFTGVCSVDGTQSAIGGDQSLSLAAMHPADINPADWRISIGEMTAYSAAWKRGDSWPQPPTIIPIDYVTRAAFLWRNGETYRYDPSISTAPLYWVSAPSNSVLARTAAVCKAPAAALPKAAAPGYGLDAPSSSDSLRLVSPTQPRSARQANADSEPDGHAAKIIQASAASQATAVMASQYQAGQPMILTIQVTPAPGVVVYAVEDQPPIGWSAAASDNLGIYDAQSGKMKWGPFFDNNARTLTYEVIPPAYASGAFQFSGAASFDGVDSFIGGDRTVAFGGTELPKLSVHLDSPTSGSGFKLSFSGNPGQLYRVEYSGDLQHWSPLDTLTNPTGVVVYPIPPVGSRTNAFYRLVPWE